MDTPASQRKRNLVIAVSVSVAALAAVVVWVWAANLFLITLDDPAAPDRSTLPSAPEDATVVGTEEICASGGCWQELTLLPPAGETPEELAARMGLEDEICSAGNIVDPRPLCRGAEPRNGALLVYSALWSRGY
jgi:hypothetical protein